MSKELQHKLLNYQLQPPGGLWDKISLTLDESSGTLAEKLISYELAPPPFIWDNVAAGLDENETPVVPFKKRFAKPLKYSTAAACLIGIAMLISLLINKKSISKEIVATPGIKQNTSVATSTAIQQHTILGSPTNTSTDSEYFAHAGIRKSHTQKVLLLHAGSSSTILNRRGNYVISHNYPINQSEFIDRYIIFSTATGEAFRLSKKLFDLFACSDNDESCRENIELMQQQMASPSVMASADFSGLLDILQSMNNQ